MSLQPFRLLLAPMEDDNGSLSLNFSSPPTSLIPEVTDYNLSCHIEAKVQSITALCICIFGLLGNSVFLFVVAKVRTLRTLLDALLINLCLADSIYLLGNTSITICIISTRQRCIFFVDLDVLCALVLLNAVVLYTSTFTVAVISYERYKAIREPLQNQSDGVNPRTRTAVFITICWSLAVVDTALQAGVTQCVMYTMRVWVKVYIDVIGLLSILVPLLCTVVCYFLVVRELGRTPRNGENSSRQKDDRQVIRMCTVTAVLTFACTFPKCLQAVISLLELSHNLRVTLDFLICLNNFAVYLLLIKSATSPIIYNVMSSRYRHAFRKAFSCNNTIFPAAGSSNTSNRRSSRQQNSAPAGI